jgi:hypothetical protein
MVRTYIQSAIPVTRVILGTMVIRYVLYVLLRTQYTLLPVLCVTERTVVAYCAYCKARFKVKLSCLVRVYY